MANYPIVTLVLKKKPKSILGVLLGTRNEALRSQLELFKKQNWEEWYQADKDDVAKYFLKKGIEYVQVYATDVRGA